MKYIQTPNALKPAGHYSQAVVHHGLVFVSGQFAVDPYTGEKKFGTAREEAALILSNIQMILKEAGSSKDQILDVSIFVSDLAYWDEINQVYGEFMGEHRPARCVVPAAALHYGFKVEIKVTAAVLSA